MFGPELLVAPVLHQGMRERRVYLPAGTDWINSTTNCLHYGGQWLDVSAPLETIPVFAKAGSKLLEILRPQ